MWRLADEGKLYQQALVCAATGAVLAVFGGIHPGAPLETFIWAFGPAVFVAVSASGDVWTKGKGLLLGAIASAIGAAWQPWELFGQATTGALVVWAINRMSRPRALDEEKASRLYRWGAMTLGAFGWPLALASIETLRQAAVLDAAPPPPGLLGFAGALTGLFMGLLKSPAHLERTPHPVVAELDRAFPVHDETLRKLLDRVLATRARALGLLDVSRLDTRTRADVRHGLDDVAMTALQLTRYFGEAARLLDRGVGDESRSRIEELRRHLAEATEPGVQRDLGEALVAVGEQQLQRERLSQGKSRLVARLERELASMECTETSLALLASGNAALSGVRLENLGERLAQHARALEAEGAALQDALGGEQTSAWAPVRTGQAPA